MILLLIPLAGLMLGVGLWIGLRGLNALNVPGGEPTAYLPPSQWEPQPQGQARQYMPPSGTSTRGSTWRDRAADIPQGWLVGVIVVSGIWILGWLIVLVIGLSLLS